MEEKNISIEISDPKFEVEHLRFMTVKSKNLKGRGDICVFVPPVEKAENLPLVILLHGVYGSAWVWTKKAGVHRTALEMIRNKEIPPMVIAMPSDGLWGDGSGYLPHNQKDYEQWIVDDVPNAVRQSISAISKTSNLFISGLSMGGFGALRLGIKYAEKFKAISAHSAITEISQMSLFIEECTMNFEQKDERENSILGILAKYGGELPKIRFDCGKQDELVTYNRNLSNAFMQANIEHVYQEFSGGHEWSYWQDHIKHTLLFFSAQN